MSPANLSTKRRWIAELARKRERASIGECRWEMVDSYDQLRHRRRNSPAKHRMRVICTSGSVGGEGGNILAYPAVLQRRGRWPGVSSPQSQAVNSFGSRTSSNCTAASAAISTFLEAGLKPDFQTASW